MNLVKFRILKKMPKTALPCDKESVVGLPTSYGLHPYTFVYYTRRSKIIKSFNGIPTSPSVFISYPLVKDNVHYVC